MADITSNLMAHWKFSNNGDDSSVLGGDHALTISGATYISDDDGNAASAVSLDGVNDSIVAATHNDFTMDANRDFTISFWVKHDGTAAYMFKARNGAAGSDQGWFVYIGANGRTQAYIYPGSGLTGKEFTDPVTEDVWHHVCVVFDRSDDCSYYLDGVFQDSVDISAYDNSNIGNSATSGIGIMHSATPVAYYSSAIDEIRVYHRALAQADITQLASYLGGVEPAAPGSSFNRVGGVERSSIATASGIDPDTIKSINGVS